MDVGGEQGEQNRRQVSVSEGATLLLTWRSCADSRKMTGNVIIACITSVWCTATSEFLSSPLLTRL